MQVEVEIEHRNTNTQIVTPANQTEEQIKITDRGKAITTMSRKMEGDNKLYAIRLR